MENSIEAVVDNLNISRNEAIRVYYCICDEMNSRFDNDETDQKINNIINCIFNNEGTNYSYDELLDRLGKKQ